MPANSSKLATIDKRPYFEKALTYGVKHGLIDTLKCEAIATDGAKGTVQVAEYFGTSHLFGSLDNARKRIVHLISLYLENLYGDNLAEAARSLQDNSLLSHSRGGNELLKKLHAMPAFELFDDGKATQTLKEFQDECTLAKPMSFRDYRRKLTERERIAGVQDAARWFAREMRVPIASLDGTEPGQLIRTALLCRLGGFDGCPSRQEFAALLVALRNTAGVRQDAAQTPVAAPRLKIPKILLENIPESHHRIADEIRREIERHDGTLMLDASRPLDEIMSILDLRYYLRETGMEDIDVYDAFVSQEWLELTKGKEDPYSRQTLLLCLAAGVKPKPAFSIAEARSLIRQVRQHGFNETVVPELISAAAPFSIRADLLSMWEDEFFPEAQTRLLDESDEKGLFAMQFLSENCNVKDKPTPKK